MHRRFLALLTAWLTLAACAPAASPAVEAIANLADPTKLATLGERGANPRVQKITYWLATAGTNGEKSQDVVDAALSRFGWKGTAKGELTKAAMIRNVAIAEKLGCLDAAGLADMRRGQSPTIRDGPYAGDQLSVDHIIPRAIVPELDNVLANLELMPLKMNRAKSAKIGARQKDMAKKFTDAGLMTKDQKFKVMVSGLEIRLPENLTSDMMEYVELPDGSARIGSDWTWIYEYVYLWRIFYIECPKDRRCQVGVGIRIGGHSASVLPFAGPRKIWTAGPGAIYVRVTDGKGPCKVTLREGSGGLIKIYPRPKLPDPPKPKPPKPPVQ